MSSNYDKTISMSREEEGTYHRREIEHLPAPSRDKSYSKTYTTHQVVPIKPSRISKHLDSSGDEDNFEEWTTSKRKVNHKTRQVETRVSRQLLVEDGKVIADSGPQVVTKIKEDNKVEECEREKAPKNKSKFDAITNATERDSASGRVLGEKKEVQRVTREVREENMKYHDERFKELTGQDVHRRAIKAPHELLTITDSKNSHSTPPRGKMVHYSNKGKLYQDTDEILEVAKLALDGSISKEVKHTHHHEEQSEDEMPDEKGEAEKLRRKPIELKSSRRRVDYVNDFDNTATPPESSGDEIEGDFDAIRRHNSSRGRKLDNDDEAIRRYHQQHRERSQSPPRGGAVEIPEVYRVNKQRLMKNKSPSSSLLGGRNKQPRERSFSPTNKSHLSHRSHRGEDASVQAHLTDEEIEKRSMKSSSSSNINSHEKQTRHLQRQSTGNSSRNYYFGQPRHQRNRASSLHSSSSASSLSDPKERMRKNGARSKDSGFKSPTNHQQIYSVSKKQKNKNNRDYHDAEPRRGGAISPTPTTGSLGQRSVKTTTTTVSAGLADRPGSRNTTKSDIPLINKHSRQNKTRGSREKYFNENFMKVNNKSVQTNTEQDVEDVYSREGGEEEEYSYEKTGNGNRRQQIGVEDQLFEDNISICSVGPNATTIKVPYKNPTRKSTAKHEIILPKQHSPIVAENIINNKQIMDEDVRNNIARRVDNIKRIPIEVESVVKDGERNYDGRVKNLDEPEHFDYKTVVATVYNTAPRPAHQNVVDTYNLKVIQHNTPFLDNKQQPIKSISDLSSSIARLELLSSELGSRKSYLQQPRHQSNVNESNTNLTNEDNNNETTFDLNNYVKTHKALPALVTDDSGVANSTSCLEDDRVSLVSSCCSLRSSRTYHISGPGDNLVNGVEDDVDSHFLINHHLNHLNPNDNTNEISTKHLTNKDEVDNDYDDNNQTNEPLDLENNEKRPAAWIFDPRDGSSTAIVAPTRPKRPESPKIDSKTEELAESKGGRSYYLELVEKERPKKESSVVRQRPSSIDSLYSRWSSHNTLNQKSSNYQPPQRQPTPTKTTPISTSNNKEMDPSRKSRQMLPATLIDATNNNNNNKPIYSSSTVVNNTKNNNLNLKSSSNNNTKWTLQGRRQLPFSGPPLSNRSKSSSCLLTSTKPSKYSIYGGLRQANAENKPVPRLSYSRAIGPKSQRQIDAQPKTPSRYLKMK